MSDRKTDSILIALLAFVAIAGMAAFLTEKPHPQMVDDETLAYHLWMDNCPHDEDVCFSMWESAKQDRRAKGE